MYFYTKNERFFDLYYYGLLEVGTCMEIFFKILKKKKKRYYISAPLHITGLGIYYVGPVGTVGAVGQ